MIVASLVLALQAGSLPVQSVNPDLSRSRTPTTSATARRSAPAPLPPAAHTPVARVISDAGHGGPDVGGPMETGSGIHENRLTYSVSLRSVPAFQSSPRAFAICRKAMRASFSALTNVLMCVAPVVLVVCTSSCVARSPRKWSAWSRARRHSSSMASRPNDRERSRISDNQSACERSERPSGIGGSFRLITF